MKNKGTRYDQNFKKMIVDLYNTKEHTYASLESEYGISAGTIPKDGYSNLRPYKLI